MGQSDQVSGRDRKRCPKCGKRKASSAFNKNASRPDGLQVNCRDCQHEQKRGNDRRRAKRPSEEVAAQAAIKIALGDEREQVQIPKVAHGLRHVDDDEAATLRAVYRRFGGTALDLAAGAGLDYRQAVELVADDPELTFQRESIRRRLHVQLQDLYLIQMAAGLLDSARKTAKEIANLNGLIQPAGAVSVNVNLEDRRMQLTQNVQVALANLPADERLELMKAIVAEDVTEAPDAKEALP